jgi:hypothetical protein
MMPRAIRHVPIGVLRCPYGGKLDSPDGFRTDTEEPRYLGQGPQFLVAHPSHFDLLRS